MCVGNGYVLRWGGLAVSKSSGSMMCPEEIMASISISMLVAVVVAANVLTVVCKQTLANVWTTLFDIL